ncbi:MOB-like protein phocein%2C partial [Xyrichtys novacula]|uniref:MOB-like protein phocein, partial n=1 Tax=Xyrichtys novacula TaxID=13765 RepID=A0AAV1H2Q6_XYRNO|nr:MOB-like protein phocein%2C partial [Xyrichtys novacula]
MNHSRRWTAPWLSNSTFSRTSDQIVPILTKSWSLQRVRTRACGSTSTSGRFKTHIQVSECHPDTCTQMTATEQWIFLCAAHKTPKECPAIDYTRHTLDGAACLLNSNKYFPSRVSIKESSVAKLGSVCRRIYRIFSHAYFHHRQIFDKYENETFLCHRFTRFVMKYNLMSKDNLIVPILEEEVQNTSSAGESEA